MGNDFTIDCAIILYHISRLGGNTDRFPNSWWIDSKLVPRICRGIIDCEPATVPFNLTPLLTSLVVSLGGLGLGYLVYRNVKAGETDPLVKPLGPVYTLLANKYYFDELYQLVFVRPSIWVSDKLSYEFIDRTVIDGFLHAVSHVVGVIGSFLRNFIDKPIVNGFGDFVGETTKKIGREVRFVQTGKIQQYMIIGLATLAAFTVLLYYLLVILRYVLDILNQLYMQHHPILLSIVKLLLFCYFLYMIF